jgi:hypothetical protein
MTDNKSSLALKVSNNTPIKVGDLESRIPALSLVGNTNLVNSKFGNQYKLTRVVDTDSKYFIAGGLLEVKENTWSNPGYN